GDHFDPRKIAERQLTAHINAAIDVGCVRLAASDQVISFWQFRGRMRITFRAPNEAVFPRADAGAVEVRGIGFLFNQYLDGAANERLRYFPGHLLLRAHGKLAAFAFDFVRDLPGHGSGPSSLFLGIGENSEALEPGFADKIEKRVEIGVRLTGKT